LSRIGILPVPIPKGVDVTVNGSTVKVSGPKGRLEQAVSPEVRVEIADGAVRCSVAGNSKDAKAKWGLYRVLIANMVRGVTEGYRRDLEIVGVGYRAEVKGKNLSIYVGHSHQVEFVPIGGVTFTVQGNNKISVSGIDKQAVGQMAADIRRVRPPEPYKGKGVRYAGEIIRKKAGKIGVSGK
jgi:large subunit ribosomal protein L6